MIAIRIEMSAPREGNDPILSVASWISSILMQEPLEGMTVHNIVVETGDA